MKTILLSVVAALGVVPAATTQCTGFDPNIGIATNIGFAISTPQTLGWSFPMPGGNLVSAIEISPHGRIFWPGIGGPDIVPTLGEFVFVPQIAPLWGNHWPGAAAADDVYFYTNNVDMAVITWKDTVPAGGGVADRFTFQLIIKDTGEISFIYDSRTPPVFPPGCPSCSFRAYVGVSEGNVVNLNHVDLSQPAVSNSGTFYQAFSLPFVPIDLAGKRIDFFPNAVGVGGTAGYTTVVYDCPLATATVGGQSCLPVGAIGPPMDLYHTSRPILGETFSFLLTQIPATAVSVQMMIGFSSLNIPLDLTFPDMVGCVLYSSNDIPAQPMGWFATGSIAASYSLGPIPSSPSAIGITLVMQGAVLVPGANALGLLLTNHVTGLTGV